MINKMYCESADSLRKGVKEYLERGAIFPLGKQAPHSIIGELVKSTVTGAIEARKPQRIIFKDDSLFDIFVNISNRVRVQALTKEIYKEDLAPYISKGVQVQEYILVLEHTDDKTVREMVSRVQGTLLLKDSECMFTIFMPAAGMKWSNM